MENSILNTKSNEVKYIFYVLVVQHDVRDPDLVRWNSDLCGSPVFVRIPR